MASRVEKYYSDGYVNTSSNTPSRSSRNARLYKEVYGKYDDLNNLPLEDNTDEIDMNRLKELLSKKEEKHEEKEVPKHLSILEQRKREIDEQRLYDINQILEKAKYENKKLKETTPLSKIDTSILSTLQNKEVSVLDITENSLQPQEDVEQKQEEELSMTRELKYQKLSEAMQGNSLMEHVMPDNDLSLDLFDDLKPTENTITTKPIRETSEIKSVPATDFHSGDTRDIDIIKEVPNENRNMDENDFFTSSYEFSKNDFFEEKKGNGIFKIILLFLATFVFIGVIFYFITTYGLGV